MEWNVNGMNTDMEVNVEGGVNWNDPCHDASLEKKFTSLFALHVNMFMHIVRCTCNYGWDGQPWQLTWATQIRTTRNEMGFLKPPGKADGPTLHLTDRTLVILSPCMIGQPMKFKLWGRRKSNCIAPLKITKARAPKTKDGFLALCRSSRGKLLLTIRKDKFEKNRHLGQCGMSIISTYTVARCQKWTSEV